MRFGTDGIRGIFGPGINYELAFRAGLGTAATLGSGKILLAMDTRISSAELYEAAKSGLLAGGADVVLLGILPSPAVSYLVMLMDAAGGMMITASHNPSEYNGIKIFGRNGLKASEEEERQIDYFLDKPPAKSGRGKKERMNGDEMYLEHLLSTTGNLDGLKIVCDCGHGALHRLAREYFAGCGAKVTTLFDTPNGNKINENCGALYPENLTPYTQTKASASTKRTLAAHDIGFSFDGDGDRLCVVKNGKVVSGDAILYTLSELTGTNTVIGTVLTNSALEKKLEQKNKKLLRTPVGDKHILRVMSQGGYTLGGEQSGHYIVRPHSVTADGLLTAGLIAKYLADGNQLNELELIPQRSISRFASEGRMECSDIQSLISNAAGKLEGKGRLVVRMSGTEPKIRLMVECLDSKLIDEILSEFDAIL